MTNADGIMVPTLQAPALRGPAPLTLLQLSLLRLNLTLRVLDGQLGQMIAALLHVIEEILSRSRRLLSVPVLHPVTLLVQLMKPQPPLPLLLLLNRPIVLKLTLAVLRAVGERIDLLENDPRVGTKIAMAEEMTRRNGVPRILSPLLERKDTGLLSGRLCPRIIQLLLLTSISQSLKSNSRTEE